MRIVAMWSGPRNISTTMMRSFGNRADTQAIDEPFYGVYLKRTGANHPYRDETLDRWPTSFEMALQWIDAPAATPIKFLKHIAYHTAGDPLDWALRKTVRNFILIRDPRAMVASFATKYEVATPIIESYAIARRLKEACAAAGAPCPVIDSADILADPSGMLRNLCAALDIEFDVAMLSWPAGSRSEDGPWAPHWYDAVNASSGFRPPKPTRITLTPALEEVAAACLGDYHALAQGRLSAGKSP